MLLFLYSNRKLAVLLFFSPRICDQINATLVSKSNAFSSQGVRVG